MSLLYERLSPTGIRLLTVRGIDDVTASLELHPYPRTEAPDYDAVSYAWGDNLSTASVICNGDSLEIRSDLLRALFFIHNFRPGPRRPLWIDAVCLNQNDPDEKADHVPLMHEVYKSASRTLVWLGEADDNSDLALDNIEDITQKLLSIKSRIGFVPSDPRMQEQLANHDLPPHGDLIWTAINALHLRPWFSRAWTLQEIILSREAVLLYGRKSTSLDAFLALHNAIVRAGLSGIVELSHGDRFSTEYRTLVIVDIGMLRECVQAGVSLPLPDLLRFSSGRRSSMPVDKVWSLLGLLNKEDQQMIQEAKLVNYSDAAIANYHETFLGIVKLHVKHDTFLALRIIEENLRTVRNPLLPSWCPDWYTDRIITLGTPLVVWAGGLAGFPGGRLCRIEPFMRVNDASLELCGLAVDAVERTTAIAGKSLVTEAAISRWLVECLKIINGTDHVFGDDAHTAPAGSRALPTAPSTGADSLLTEKPKLKYMHAIEAVEGVLRAVGDTKGEKIGFCEGRKFFRTTAGRFGIGPAELREGDLLCAIYGAKTIWALRPYSLPKEARGQQTSEVRQQDTAEPEYELLGSTHIGSLFNGEAWEGTSCESMERFRIR